MVELTDLEICKRIAKIDDINFTTCIDKSKYPHREAIYHRLYEGTRPAPMYRKAMREYNPLTDDALCFQLMIKYKVDFIPYYPDKYLAQIKGSYIANKSPNKAICLTLIEAHNE